MVQELSNEYRRRSPSRLEDRHPEEYDDSEVPDFRYIRSPSHHEYESRHIKDQGDVVETVFPFRLDPIDENEKGFQKGRQVSNTQSVGQYWKKRLQWQSTFENDPGDTYEDYKIEKHSQDTAEFKNTAQKQLITEYRLRQMEQEVHMELIKQRRERLRKKYEQRRIDREMVRS